MLSLLFDGRVWAQQLGHGKVSDLEVKHLFSQSGSGLHSLKFKLSLPENFYDPVLDKGTKVEVFCGDEKLGSAVLADPDRDNWNFTADGLYRLAEETRAADAVGNTTSDITEAITAANLRGLGWNGAGDLDFEGLAYQKLEDQGDNATIASLFNAYCLFRDRFWGLDENDVPYIRPRPTVPKWALTPGLRLMPTTDDTSVRSVKIKFLTGGTPAAPTSWGYVVVPAEIDPDDYGRDVFIDISELGTGPGGAPNALAWANDYYEAMQTRVAYTEDLQVVPGQLTNTGSVPLSFWSTPLQVLGEMGLHHGAFSRRLGSDDATLKWICGMTTIRDDPDTGMSLTMAAVDFAPRRVPDVIARMNDWYRQQGLGTTIDIYGLPPWYRTH